jgi:hypothetical protein
MMTSVFRVNLVCILIEKVSLASCFVVLFVFHSPMLISCHFLLVFSSLSD